MNLQSLAHPLLRRICIEGIVVVELASTTALAYPLLRFICIDDRGVCLAAYSFNTLGSPDEVVEKRAQQRGKQDNQHPGNFIIAFGWFFRKTVYENPYPEYCCEDCNAIEADGKETK